MQELRPPYEKLVLVCANVKADGACCAARGGEEFRLRLKEAVKAKGWPVRVSKSGCLGQCPLGMNVVIMPDNRWLSGVSESDLEAILEIIRPSA